MHARAVVGTLSGIALLASGRLLCGGRRKSSQRSSLLRIAETNTVDQTTAINAHSTTGFTSSGAVHIMPRAVSMACAEYLEVYGAR